MKKYLIALLILLFSTPSFAFQLIGAGAAGGSSFILEEDFEGTGTPSGWTTSGSGTINFDYTTTVLAGSHSLYTYYANDNHMTYAESGSIGEIDEVYISFLWYPDDFSGHAEADKPFFIVVNSSGTALLRLATVSDGGIEVQMGGAVVVTGSFTAEADTTYRVWIKGISNSGASNMRSVWFTSAATTDWPTGAANFSRTYNDSGIAFDKLRFGAQYLGKSVFDSVRVSDETFNLD